MTDQTKRPVQPVHDLLFGAHKIAAYLGIGKRDAKRLCRDGALPSFALGGVLCARRSSLTRHFDTLEAGHGERQ